MPERIKAAQEVIAKSPRQHGGRKLAAQVSPHDERDYKYSVLAPFIAKAEAKQMTNYRANMPPVFDQGNKGTCVAASSAWGFKAFEEVDQGDFPAQGLSTAYLYSRCKQIDGLPGQAGTFPRAAMQVLQKDGVCPEDKLPYSWLTSDVNVPPPPLECDQYAAQYKIKTYAQVCATTDNNLQARIDLLRHAILNTGPIEIAVFVLSNFMQPQPPDYIIPYPEGSWIGGHGLCLCDMDDNRELFTIRNTWGPGWGDQGYAYIPYDWVTKTFDPIGNGTQVPFFMEAWTAVDLVIPKPAGRILMKVGSNVATVDGEAILLDQPPITDQKTGRALVPVRFLADNLGLLVQYNNGVITLQRPDGSLTIVMTINQQAATVNGVMVQLDQPPVIDESTSRTLLPVRFLAENAGYNVAWDGDSQTIILTRK